MVSQLLRKAGINGSIFDSYVLAYARVSTAISAVPTASTGIRRRSSSTRCTTTMAHANSTSDSNMLLNCALPDATQRQIMYTVWTNAPAISVTVVATAKRRCSRVNKLAVASSKAAKYPARPRLNVGFMCFFGDRQGFGHHRGGPFADDVL